MSVYVEKTRKTKEQIYIAFLRLLEEKPFETVTVSDIAQGAGINRGTFYLHFHDKFDLLEKMEQQLLAELGAHLDKLQSGGFPRYGFQKQQETLAAALFGFISMRACVLRLFFGSNGPAGFHFKFRDAFSEKVRANLEKVDGFTEQLKVPMEYFLMFITSAFLGLVEQWAQQGFDRTPEEMTNIYIGVIRHIQGKCADN